MILVAYAYEYIHVIYIDIYETKTLGSKISKYDILLVLASNYDVWSC